MEKFSTCKLGSFGFNHLAFSTGKTAPKGFNSLAFIGKPLWPLSTHPGTNAGRG